MFAGWERERNNCQENIENDAKKHAQINWKTMMELCSTNHPKNIGKGTRQMTNIMQEYI